MWSTRSKYILYGLYGEPQVPSRSAAICARKGCSVLTGFFRIGLAIHSFKISAIKSINMYIQYGSSPPRTHFALDFPRISVQNQFFHALCVCVGRPLQNHPIWWCDEGQFVQNPFSLRCITRQLLLVHPEKKILESDTRRRPPLASRTPHKSEVNKSKYLCQEYSHSRF